MGVQLLRSAHLGTAFADRSPRSAAALQPHETLRTCQRSIGAPRPCQTVRQLPLQRSHSRPSNRCLADSRSSIVAGAFALQAGAPLGDGFANDLDVGTSQGQSPQQDIVTKLKQAGQRLTSFAIRLATLVAQTMLHSVAARIAQQQALRRLAQEQQQRAQQALAAAARAREAARASIQQSIASRSKADRAFVKMLLRQDNPARSLEDKWQDLCQHMRSNQAPEFRRKTARLFSAALDSSHAVQLALQSEADKGRKGLDRIVQQHDCEKEEADLRSLLFAQMLTEQQS